MADQYANDSHREIQGGYIKPPGVPLTNRGHHPGEQCAVLGQAYNPALGHAGGWTAGRMIDAAAHPELVQPGQVLVTKGYDDAARHGHAGGIMAKEADRAHIMRTHTIGVVTAPDKDGNFWAIEQWQGKAAHLQKENVASYHHQAGNNFQILTDEGTGRVSRSPQMIADAQRLAQRDGNQEVVAATTKTLQDMGNPRTLPNEELGHGGPAHGPQSKTPAQPQVEHARNGLEQGARGQAVTDLQTKLAALGYLDASKDIDGSFGNTTRDAVKRFQTDHHQDSAHLTVDGKVGTHTAQALDAAVNARNQEKAPGPDKAPNKAPDKAQGANLLSDPKNPDHAMYKQALDAVNKFEAKMGRAPDQYSEQLAAALVVSAKREGLNKIDQVVISKDGTQAMAVQGQLDSSLRKVAPVQTAQAANTPVEQSSAAAQALPKPAEPAPAAPQAAPPVQAQNGPAPVAASASR